MINFLGISAPAKTCTRYIYFFFCCNNWQI